MCNTSMIIESLVRCVCWCWALPSMLRTLAGPAMKIHILSDACPFRLNAARVIPFAWRDDIKAQIATMVRQSVIEPLGDLPRAWCHPVVIVPKPRGGLGICAGLTKLNRYVDRAYYSLKSLNEAISEVTSGQNTSQLRVLLMDTGRCHWMRPASTSLPS